VWLTSDKPVIVNHLLGFAPTIKWWSPIEKIVTQAMISPFIAVETSVIESHQLHIMIPRNVQQNMIIRELRSGVVTTPGLTFYTNTSNSDYVIATREYGQSDDVRIELVNPHGFIAYMTGLGRHESYIFSAGSSSFNLENYFSIATRTEPVADTHFSATQRATHTFASTDQITVKRRLERKFNSISWLINGEAYTDVTETTNIDNAFTIPASALNCGKNSIAMSVYYADAGGAESVYTGYVWIGNQGMPSDIDISGEQSLCYWQVTSTTLAASVAAGSAIPNPTFRWYASQSATEPLQTGASYTPTLLLSTTTYCVSVSDEDNGICENEPGERKEVTVTVETCTFPVPVNPHLRTRVNASYSFLSKMGTTPTTFGTTPTTFGTTPTTFGTTPTAFGTTPTAFGTTPTMFGTTPTTFGTTPTAFGTNPTAFGTTPTARGKERNKLAISKL
jgi:hypothetical protein